MLPTRVNRLARRLALQALLEYMQGGNTALGAYRDKKHPAAVAETFASLIGRFEALPVYLPELNEYLLEYPKAKSDNVAGRFLLGEGQFRIEADFPDRTEDRLSGSNWKRACLRSG